MKCRHMFSLQGSWRWGPFTNPDNLIRETDARDPRAGLLLGITEGDSTHKDKWEGGLDGFTTAVTRSETDSRLESKQERETEFYDGWRLYQRVTGGMCLVFSECTFWPLPTGRAIPLLKIEALTKWDTYHLAKWRGEKTWQYMRLEKCPNPTYWIKLVHVILDELCLMFSEHSGKVLSKLRTILFIEYIFNVVKAICNKPWALICLNGCSINVSSKRYHTIHTLHCQKYWHPLLMKGLTTLVISMSTNLYV